MDKVGRQIDLHLAEWARKKYKGFRRTGRAIKWVRGIKERTPGLFAHWMPGAFDGLTVRAG